MRTNLNVVKCVIGSKQQSIEKASSFVKLELGSITSEGKLITWLGRGREGKRRSRGREEVWKAAKGERERVGVGGARVG